MMVVNVPAEDAEKADKVARAGMNFLTECGAKETPELRRALECLALAALQLIKLAND